jgi:phosphoglycolate phosphatase
MPPVLKPECVLFDLDGTLVDTAPDLLACLDQALQQAGQKPANAEALRPYISYGAAIMIDRAVSGDDSKLKDSILQTMLALYQQNIARHSQLFTGLESLLNWLDDNTVKWGVVTNKRQRFTHPLMAAFKLDHRAACIVSGDTTANSKPHPEPMLKACEIAAVSPENCIYIGDAEHDIQAGRNSGMKTVAALYGYLKPDDQPDQWGADVLVDSPEHLKHWIQSQC